MFKIFKKRKPIIAIDLDEIIRSKFIQVDRYYYEEFGEEGTPKENYVIDFFNEYKWEPINREISVLKDEDEEEVPELSPKYYEVDKNGESKADAFLFNKEKEVLSSKEVYNRFMYEDYLFEIHASAPTTYKNVGVDLEKLVKEYSNDYDFAIFSKENPLSIPPTLFFLSKVIPRVGKYFFINDEKEIWDLAKIVITTNPVYFKTKPLNKKIVKIKRPYNKNVKSKIEVLQLENLLNNEKLKKYIK